MLGLHRRADSLALSGKQSPVHDPGHQDCHHHLHHLYQLHHHQHLHEQEEEEEEWPCDDWDFDDNPQRQIDDAVRTMDTTCHATFATWVRDRQNWTQVGPHLLRLSRDYHVEQVVEAVAYVGADWSPRDLCTLLLPAFEWHPALVCRFLQSRPQKLLEELTRSMPIDRWSLMLRHWTFIQASDLLRPVADRVTVKRILSAAFL